jgi:SAM-dependent methyltransferase
MSKQSELEKLYELFPWIEDPETPEGYERFKRTISDMEHLATHPWIQGVLGFKRTVKILDVCSGTGIGGVAFAKVLKTRGVDFELTMIDLRLSALEKAKKFSMRELSVEPEIIVADVTEPINLSEKFDSALLWGSTTPHFNPWTWIRVLSNVSSILVDDGVFIYDEADRVRSIIMTRFNEINPELVEEDKVVITVHGGRDARTGNLKSILLDLASDKRVVYSTYLWDIASSAAFTWVFFEDVDFVPLRSQYSGVVIAYKPRRTIEPRTLHKTPRIISQ